MVYNVGSRWTEEAEAHLKGLWIKGLAASQIAKSMGKSRNQIIGKLHRLNLTGIPRISHPSRQYALNGQPKSGKPQTGQDRHKAPKVKKSHEAERITAKQTHAGKGSGDAPHYTPKKHNVDSPNPVSILDLKSFHCRSVDDDGLFCGNRCEEGSSWCKGHRRIFCMPVNETPQKRADRQTAWLANYT